MKKRKKLLVFNLIITIIFVIILFLFNNIKTAEIRAEQVHTNAALISSITPNDYGKKINYSVIVNGKVLDNWRIFYNDKESKTIKIITTDYITHDLISKDVLNAGVEESYLDTNYSVICPYGGQRFVEILNTTEYWSEYAAGVNGATATGGPTDEEFISSWNENPETDRSDLLFGKDYRYCLTDTTTKIDDKGLYMPRKTKINGCRGYWIATLFTQPGYNVFSVDGTEGSLRSFNSNSPNQHFYRFATCSFFAI